MAKKPISYTSRDFESIKDSLVNYTKRYYPNTFKDFNEASFGALMLDLVSYIGDQLSFYVDYQANESFLDSALEFKNIVRLAKTMGHKMPGAASSTGRCSFFVIVPASTTTTGPDFDYIPILKRGTVVSAGTGANFTLNEDVDFTDPSNSVTVATVDDTTGVPTSFAIKSYGKVISGRQQVQSISVGSYERFRNISLVASNVVEIISVTDTQGNEYLEVDYLTQDYVLSEIPNYQSNRTAVPYLLKAKPAPRRFTTEFDSLGNAALQFGYGSEENLTNDVIADPADVVLDVMGKTYINDKNFDPSNLITSDKFGVVPVDTNLTVLYRANSVDEVNVSVGSIDTVSNIRFAFKNPNTLNASRQSEVISSLEVTNEDPILGDTEDLLPDEMRERAYASFASQNRAVTRSDYMSVCYRMPAKFGKIKRANIIQDSDSFRRNLNMYVLSEDSTGNYTVPNETLKNNLKVWLSQYKMMNDSIDIFDGKIINYGINFEIVPELDQNRYDILQRCVNELVSKLSVKKDIGEAIYISEIYKFLNDVPGVVDATNVEIYNRSGGVYSNLFYDVDSNISDNGRFVLIPQDTVAELLFPQKDIQGVVK